LIIQTTAAYEHSLYIAFCSQMPSIKEGKRVLNVPPCPVTTLASEPLPTLSRVGTAVHVHTCNWFVLCTPHIQYQVQRIIINYKYTHPAESCATVPLNYVLFRMPYIIVRESYIQSSCAVDGLPLNKIRNPVPQSL